MNSLGKGMVGVVYRYGVLELAQRFGAKVLWRIGGGEWGVGVCLCAEVPWSMMM